MLLQMVQHLIKKVLKQDSENLKVICRDIRNIGAPKYYPKYMIQHGINAFMDKGDTGINENFNREESWKLALESYLHCQP